MPRTLVHRRERLPRVYDRPSGVAPSGGERKRRAPQGRRVVSRPARKSTRARAPQQPSAPRARVRAVHEALFSVPVRDLERSDQRRSWEIPPTWIDRALADSEARSDGTPGKLELYLKKQGR